MLCNSQRKVATAHRRGIIPRVKHHALPLFRQIVGIAPLNNQITLTKSECCAASFIGEHAHQSLLPTNENIKVFYIRAHGHCSFAAYSALRSSALPSANRSASRFLETATMFLEKVR